MIRIQTTLTSDTPHLPELAPLVGRAVTITVQELPPGTRVPTPEQVRAAQEAAEQLRQSGFDFSFYDLYNEVEQKAAEDLGR